MKNGIVEAILKIVAEFLPVAKQYLANRSETLPTRLEEREESESLRYLKRELKKSRKARRLIKSLNKLTKRAQKNEIDLDAFFEEFEIKTFMSEVDRDIDDTELREKVREHFVKIRDNRKKRRNKKDTK